MEFELLDLEGEIISLHENNVVYIKRNGEAIVPNTDHTLWFNKARETSTYIYEIKTINNIVYKVILEWINENDI